jgi:chemotaxis protein MotB
MKKTLDAAPKAGRKRGRRSGRRSGDGDPIESRDRWLLSYADLMTLLLALFIVLYAAADRERATKIATAMAAQFDSGGVANAPAASGVLPGADSLVAARAAIDRVFITNSSLRDRARVKTNERGVVVSLTEAGFFAPADASIREDALPVLEALAQALRESQAQVRVEGHTDSLPISTARYPSNWELSAARAATVLSHLVEAGVPSSRLSVAGFAGERPVGDNSTAEGRALNRRVDLVILRSNE